MLKNNLDFMRTLLALGVMSLHTLQVVGVQYPQFPWVPSFIAISGYLITASMECSRGYLQFAWKRFLRLTPAFLLSLVLVAILGGDVCDALYDWLFMAFSSRGVNPPLWSLSLEVVLYFFLAVWFGFGVYSSQRNASKILLGFFFCIVISFFFAPSSMVHVYIVTLSFISGSFLYVVRDKVRWFPLLGWICLVVAGVMRNLEILKGSLGYVLLVGPFLAYGLMTVAFHTKPIFARYKDNVGEPSLGIYVYHYPILKWCQGLGLQGGWLVVVTFVLTLFLALCSWHMVEQKILEHKDCRFFTH